LSYEDLNLEALTITDGATALDIAVNRGNIAMKGLLVAHGATHAAAEAHQRPQPKDRSVGRGVQSDDESGSDEASE
jgi:hypothetical protein